MKSEKVLDVAFRCAKLIFILRLKSNRFYDIIFSTNNFPKPLDFSHSVGIMCITNRKERRNDRLKAILLSKISLTHI